ncbi:hypothetical protein Lser_V15G32882 [Lactuca serriola]
MLNKRFKIAKCKTSLKLATSRIKLLKNKKLIQINQMKRELAQLLESGQDRTARIRVEHVIREEKMIAAYELIEIYCELIVARLPIIESQKTCPIDLKEAITSVIFAAPRCSDIPELVDARKNFTAKYGKEFASAALELRPDSGVNRMMVEKLSAVAPDIQTKLKVLSAVAKEHNVDWDSTLFEETESKPKDDLLNGSVKFENVSMMNVDSPKMQTSNIQNVQSHMQKLNVTDDFTQQNRRYTLGSQNITSNDTKPSGMASEMMNKRHSFHTNTNNASSGRENNWNMEFKDAMSAAQAAAESAERASMAARAAAELSSKGKIGSPKVSTTSEVFNQHQFKDSFNNNSFNNRNSKIQKNPQTDESEHDTSPKSRIRKQTSHQHDVFVSQQQKYGQRTVVDQGNLSRDDETDSDDDENPKFDTGFEYNEGDAKSFFPSPDREESSPLQNTHISSPKQKTQKVNSRKTRIELNDLVEKDSRVSLRNEKKKKDIEIEPQIVEKNSEFLNQGDDLGTGKELKFGTLTGGLRNSGGLKYTPHTKGGITDSSPLSKPNSFNSKESGYKNKKQSVSMSSSESELESDDQSDKYVRSSTVNDSSSSSFKKLVGQTSKPSSFNSRASGMEKKEPSVSMSSSESESDDQSDKKVKNRSRFAPPDVFFNDGGITDSDEEVVLVTKPTSTGLSRRTKGYVEAEGKPVISKASMHPSTNESPTKRISEHPRKKIVESGKSESPKASNLSSQTSLEGNDVKKPSHVHPNLPDYDSLAARIQSLQANHR